MSADKGITIEVPGTPTAGHRPRLERSGHLYVKRETRDYQALIRMAAMAALAGREPLDGPLVVWITARLPVPASWSAKKKQQAYDGDIWPTPRPDLDNYIKGSLDAVNGVLWTDDARICSLHADKIYAREPGLVITVRGKNGKTR